jgi:hypothetical protein
MTTHPRFSSLIPSLRVTSVHHLRQYAIPCCISALLWTLALLWSQQGNAAVLVDLHPLEPFSTHLHTTVPNPGVTQPASSPPYDLGYFTVETESCVPLGPAADTITALITNVRTLTTQETAALSYHWRQVQHHKAESAQAALLCHYIAH